MTSVMPLPVESTNKDGQAVQNSQEFIAADCCGRRLSGTANRWPTYVLLSISIDGPQKTGNRLCRPVAGRTAGMHRLEEVDDGMFIPERW